ncbi:ABC transporter ATP-binding protein [soil metagenome]
MITITNLRKRFGPLVALDNISLELGPGELFGFIGPNGAGKSTTMKILAGLMRQDSGDARVCGLDPRKDADRVKRSLGYMPDFIGVYDDLTVDEYLQFFAAAFGIAARNGKRRSVIDSVLQLTDLTEKRHAMVDSLSRGMTQRLGVARVLLHEPRVLLLDEPASGLDPRARIELREILLTLRQMGKTLMVSSHILAELGEMSTSIGIIEKGKMVYAGSLRDALQKAGVGDRVCVALEGEAGAGGGGVSDAEAQRVALVLERDTRVARVGVEGRQLTIDLVKADGGGASSHHFLLQALMESGARVESFTPRTVKLEDAFLRLTKGVVN